LETALKIGHICQARKEKIMQRLVYEWAQLTPLRRFTASREGAPEKERASGTIREPDANR